MTSPGRDEWEAAIEARLTGDPELVVDVKGFEGPLDLLLHLARRQKVDLARISILALSEQYIRFVGEARALRLELAADYLVMAAWLAYLKSKLLLPEKPDAEAPSGDDMAAALRFRLQRLEAMRAAAEQLMNGRQLGRDVFARGRPEATAAVGRPAFKASLHDLLSAYAAQRQRRVVTEVTIAERGVWSLAEARERLEGLMGRIADWTALERFLGEFIVQPAERVTATASAFAASLELVREGKLEMRQDEAFAPLFLRPAERGGAALRVVP